MDFDILKTITLFILGALVVVTWFLRQYIIKLNRLESNFYDEVNDIYNRINNNYNKLSDTVTKLEKKI